MPHVKITCFPKNLGEKELNALSEDMTQLIKKHLNASDDSISVDYEEVKPENWKEVISRDIKPRYDLLLKKPGYEV